MPNANNGSKPASVSPNIVPAVTKPAVPNPLHTGLIKFSGLRLCSCTCSCGGVVGVVGVLEVVGDVGDVVVLGVVGDVGVVVVLGVVGVVVVLGVVGVLRVVGPKTNGSE